MVQSGLACIKLNRNILHFSDTYGKLHDTDWVYYMDLYETSKKQDFKLSKKWIS